MVNYFTESRGRQLVTVNDSLTCDWRNFFFRPLKSVVELKEITFSMLSMHWHYFYSALVKALESFNAFFQTAYYLLTANFSEAKSEAYKTVASSLASVRSILLAATWVYLSFLRLTMLLMSTLVSVCTGFDACGASNSKRQTKSAVLGDIIQSLKEYNRTADVVIKERSQIQQVLNDFSDEAGYRLAQLQSSHGLFSEGAKVVIIDNPARRKRNELLSELEELMKSYPQFEYAKGDELNYIRWIHKDLEEHHAQTLIVAELVFSALNAVICPQSSEQQRNISL